MENMGIWFKPVRMTDIEPPALEHVGDYVYTSTHNGMELVRCDNVGEKLYLPDQIASRWVTALGAGAMSNCEQLKSAVLPRSLRRIGDYAFFQCEKLEEVRITGEVREIGDGAFAFCASLKNLYVPPTVETIGDGAFEGVENLTLSGAENSAIHRYAQEHGMFFMAASGPHAA